MGHLGVCQRVCKSFVCSLLSSPPTRATLPGPLLLPDPGRDKAALWSPPQRSDRSLILRDTEAAATFSLPDLWLYLAYTSCVIHFPVSVVLRVSGLILCCGSVNLYQNNE